MALTWRRIRPAFKAAVTAAAASGKAVYVPAGNYLLDNSAAAVLSGAQNVLIYGDGPSSSLACQTIGTNDCIASTGATGFGLCNLAICFRTGGHCPNIGLCGRHSNPAPLATFDGVTLNNGDLSGFRLASSVHTSIHNLSISNFEANGTVCHQRPGPASERAFLRKQCRCLLRDLVVRLAVLGLLDSVPGYYGSGDHQLERYVKRSYQFLQQRECEWLRVGRLGERSGFRGRGQHHDHHAMAGSGFRFRMERSMVPGYGTNSRNTASAQALYINVAAAPGAGVISHIALSNIVATHIRDGDCRWPNCRTTICS